MSASSGYEVGYGKPPKAGQFAKGQSGNPAGRKKGARSHSEILAKAMNEKVTITINGQKRTMTMMELAFTQQTKKAAEGDRHAVKLLMALFGDLTDREEARQAGSPQDAQEREAAEAMISAGLNELAKTLQPGGAKE